MNMFIKGDLQENTIIEFDYEQISQDEPLLVEHVKETIVVIHSYLVENHPKDQ
jgi:hypothetical protein